LQCVAVNWQSAAYVYCLHPFHLYFLRMWVWNKLCVGVCVCMCVCVCTMHTGAMEGNNRHTLVCVWVRKKVYSWYTLQFGSWMYTVEIHCHCVHIQWINCCLFLYIYTYTVDIHCVHPQWKYTATVYIYSGYTLQFGSPSILNALPHFIHTHPHWQNIVSFVGLFCKRDL